MAGRIDARLIELGIELPVPREPKAAKILHHKQSGNLLFISGQVPRVDGEISFIGKVGREYSLAQGQEAARNSALCVLGAARAALDGDLNQFADAVDVEADEGVALDHANALVMLQEAWRIVPRNSVGGLGQVVGAEAEELGRLCNITSAQAGAGQFDHGADQER